MCLLWFYLLPIVGGCYPSWGYFLLHLAPIFVCCSLLGCYLWDLSFFASVGIIFLWSFVWSPSPYVLLHWDSIPHYFIYSWPMKVALVGLFDSHVGNRLPKAFLNLLVIVCPLGWFDPNLREDVKIMVWGVPKPLYFD